MTCTNGTAISVGGESASDNVCCCSLADAYKTVPKGAEYVSLRIKGVAVPVHNAEDVLIWVCKKMSLYRSHELRDAMIRKHPGWLKPNCRDMMCPYRISHNCYLNMDCAYTTTLFRAAKILEWLAWPRADASLTYREPPPKIIVHPAPVAPVVVEKGSKPEEKPVAKKTARERVKEMMKKDLLQPDPEFDEMFKGVEPDPEAVHETATDSDFDELKEEVGGTASVANAKANDTSLLMAKAKAVGGKAYVYKHNGSLMTSGEKPVSLFVGETEYPLKNWRDLMVKTCDILDEKNHQLLHDLAFRVGDTFLAYNPVGMRSPKLHEQSGLYLEMGLPPYSIVLHSQLLFRKFAWKLDEIGIVYIDRDSAGATGVETRRRASPSVSRALDRIEKGELASIGEFADDIAANYSNGFDFKETSRRLVEKRVGKPMSDAMIEIFQAMMFERSDGMWFMPLMVLGKENRERMVERAKELLEREGAFALDSLYAEFEGLLKNISQGRDFKRFFNKYVAEKVHGKVHGHEGWRVCFKSDTTEEEGWAAIASRVRDVLVASGDAVPIADILSQMSHLDREVILRVCQENLKDAITFSLDDIEYVKLLEAYYLPDDFGETLSSFVTESESNNGIVSIVLLEAEFDAKYGDGFRVNFGLEDDDVFKQVISASYDGEIHCWKKDMFVCESRRAEANVAEAFLQTHVDIFHEEEFFKFALESRGMSNRSMLILTFLRKYCVRLSKEWWVSKKGFDEKVHLSADAYSKIGEALNSSLGNNAFKPMAMLPSSLFDNLPRLELDGKEIEWNHYLLTSISVWKIKNAHVVNDEPSPYTVTAMIIPAKVGDVSDVVSYVLRAFPSGYFQDSDAAFDYLKSNNIRMTKTGKLVAKINEIIKVN